MTKVGIKGWYPDPTDDNLIRYWDGQRWVGKSRYRAVVPSPRQRWSEMDTTIKIVLGVMLLMLVAFIVFLVVDLALSSRNFTTDLAGASVAQSCYDAGHEPGTDSFAICVRRTVAIGESSGLNDTYAMVGPDGEPVYGTDRSDLIEKAALAWRPTNT